MIVHSYVKLPVSYEDMIGYASDGITVMTDWESFVGVDVKFHIHGHVGSDKTINAEFNHFKWGWNY